MHATWRRAGPPAPGEDAQYALVGGLAVPIGSRSSPAWGEVAGGALSRVPLGARHPAGGRRASPASANALVRAALGQGIDPGELASRGLPLVPVVGGRARPTLPRVPLGFADAEEFPAFAAHLTEGLRDAGYGDAIPVFQGSSVTGVKYTTGEPFDVGRTSDFDIALASPRSSTEPRPWASNFGPSDVGPRL